MSLEMARLRLDNVSQRTWKFIDENIEKWATEEIVERIRTDARALGLSNRVISAITFERTGFMVGDIVFDLSIDGVPVDEFLENGTRPHVIEPKGKDAGGANVLRWLSAAGNPIFRKRVQHPGFRGYHLIRDGKQKYEDDLRKRIEQESENMAQVERLR